MPRKPAGESRIKEIKFLRKTASKCKNCFYLAGLFTDELLVWAETQIKNNARPDIMSYLKRVQAVNSQLNAICKVVIEDIDKTMAALNKEKAELDLIKKLDNRR